MTPITETVEVSPVPAETMLLDMAYLLKFARRVKAEMCAEKSIIARTWERVLVA